MDASEGFAVGSRLWQLKHSKVPLGEGKCESYLRSGLTADTGMRGRREGDLVAQWLNTPPASAVLKNEGISLDGRETPPPR